MNLFHIGIRHMKYKILFGLAVFLFYSMSNLGHSADLGPFRGKVVNEVTKEPIEGAVVLFE